jgi:hypothetical protein
MVVSSAACGNMLMGNMTFRIPLLVILFVVFYNSFYFNQHMHPIYPYICFDYLLVISVYIL